MFVYYWYNCTVPYFHHHHITFCRLGCPTLLLSTPVLVPCQFFTSSVSTECHQRTLVFSISSLPPSKVSSLTVGSAFFLLVILPKQFPSPFRDSIQNCSVILYLAIISFFLYNIIPFILTIFLYTRISEASILSLHLFSVVFAFPVLTSRFCVWFLKRLEPVL